MNKTKDSSSLPLRSNCANKSSNSDFLRHYNKILNRIDISLNSSDYSNNNDNKNIVTKNDITITRASATNCQNVKPIFKLTDYGFNLNRTLKRKK